MKIRTILNGIVALSIVGAFYTFAFCMTDKVDTDQISGEYYYNTATQTEPITTPAKTEKASADILHNTANNNFIKENPDLPKDSDHADVNKNINRNPQYEAVTEIPVDDVVVTPLYDATTVVPVQTTPEDNTQSAAILTEIAEDNTDYENVPEDIEDEMVISENKLSETDVNAYDAQAYTQSTGDDLLSELQRQQAAEDIQRRLNEMQSSLTQAETTTTAEEYITSSGTYFETTPADSQAVSSDTELTTVLENGSEILTAKVGGTVQEFDAYQLICMIVSTEMSPSFSTEALKAQAVASYSYVKYHNVKGLVPTVLVKRDIPKEVSEAVTSVWGKCCYYNGAPAQTVYSASSAGTTASATNVWGGENVPYLVSIATPFDVQSDPNYGVISTYSADTIRSALESNLGIKLSDNPENWMTITSRVDGNYVASVNIDGQTSISGRKIREQILKYGLKSWCFDVSYADGEFTFVTYGYGHGVGMSQNGANILGKQGYSYDQILAYYFPGTTVS